MRWMLCLLSMKPGAPGIGIFCISILAGLLLFLILERGRGLKVGMILCLWLLPTARSIVPILAGFMLLMRLLSGMGGLMLRRLLLPLPLILLLLLLSPLWLLLRVISGLLPVASDFLSALAFFCCLSLFCLWSISVAPVRGGTYFFLPPKGASFG